MRPVKEELKLQTEVGEMTALFELEQNTYVAWFKEMPEVIVQANSIGEAINELHISLEAINEYKNYERRIKEN